MSGLRVAATGSALVFLSLLASASCSPATEPTTATAIATATSVTVIIVSPSVPTPASTTTAASTTSSTITVVLFPAVDSFLPLLRLEVTPREDVRVAVGGLRETASDGVESRKRVIEGELIIENLSPTPFAYTPDDFRLYVGPFQSQILGMTASTDFPVSDAILAPVRVGAHPFLTAGEVAPGATLHGYLLTFVADQGTSSSINVLGVFPESAKARAASSRRSAAGA